MTLSHWDCIWIVTSIKIQAEVLSVISLCVILDLLLNLFIILEVTFMKMYRPQGSSLIVRMSLN